MCDQNENGEISKRNEHAINRHGYKNQLATPPQLQSTSNNHQLTKFPQPSIIPSTLRSPPTHHICRRMPPSVSMSSGRFWSLTIGLLLVWAIVIATAATPHADAPNTHSTSKTAKSKALWRAQQDPGVEQRNAHNCKTLCQHCGCLGFYCGEECICEYNKHHSNEGHNSSDSSDTECIATMQKDALKLRIPFEMLIQGPSNNRFVRNALQFDQNAARTRAAADASRNRRYTVVIYKPATTVGDNLLQNPADSAQTRKALLAAARHKRSISQLDWFSDLANTLVRPAPLSGIGQGNRKREAAHSEEEQHAGPVEKLESWFTDHSNLLVRPAPLFRRQGTSAAADTDDANDTSGLPVGRVIKHTLRQIQDADFGQTLRTQFKEGADMLQNSLDTNNFNIFPQNMREQLAETMRSLQKRPVESQTPAMLASAEATPAPAQFKMRWFRPMRFLQRVQQALNN